MFRRMLTFNSDGGPRLPARVEFDGIEVDVKWVRPYILLTVSEAAPEIRVDFVITRAWPGARLTDGTLLNVGVLATVLFAQLSEISVAP